MAWPFSVALSTELCGPRTVLDLLPPASRGCRGFRLSGGLVGRWRADTILLSWKSRTVWGMKAECKWDTQILLLSPMCPEVALGSKGARTGGWSHLGLAWPLAAASALNSPHSLGVRGPGWCQPGPSPRLTALSQGRLPAGWERSPGSLPLPWHTGAQRLCCTSQENGP